MATEWPTIGDAIGHAMARNARMAAEIKEARAVEDALIDREGN